ncbi:MAG: hypothetical protein ABI343_06055 [Burkholderiaceae bacterium]
MQSGAQRIELALDHLVGSDAPADAVADASCAIWHSVASALSPVIGQRGVAALYRRSLHLRRNDALAPPAAHEEAIGRANFDELRSALAAQTGANAAAMNNALLGTFYDLLSNLIGSSLTERLLASVWERHSIDHSGQDPIP